MQIPKKLPQFKKKPAIFIASGEYEAKFYLALDGKLELKKHLRMPPRQEAREKQGFITFSKSPAGFGAVGHKGRYLENLKKRFQHKVCKTLRELLKNYNQETIKEVYLFAPSYVISKIIAGLNKEEIKMIRMKFSCEIAKMNPLRMIEIFEKESRSAVLKNSFKK